MTPPLALAGSMFEAVLHYDGNVAGQLPAATALARIELHEHFADRAAALRKELRPVRAKLDTLLVERLVEAEEFRCLGEAVHEQAEEADALLIILVCCEATDALMQDVEKTFDRLREMEEQIAEAFEPANGTALHRVALGSSPTGHPCAALNAIDASRGQVE